MTFYEQVRAFFKKYDPARIRLAKKVALAYKTPRAQKAAMKRLHEVYAAGGPSKFDFGKGKVVKATKSIESEPAKVENNEENSDGEVEAIAE